MSARFGHTVHLTSGPECEADAKPEELHIACIDSSLAFRGGRRTCERQCGGHLWCTLLRLNWEYE